MSVLTSQRVHDITQDCLFNEDEPLFPRVQVNGILHNYAFEPNRLSAHRAEIEAMLAELPEQYGEHTGGGWSFLNLCMDKHDNQWTGEHWVQEMLVALGMAIGRMEWMPTQRPLWAAMPGGMPYVILYSEARAVELVTQEPAAEEGGPDLVTVPTRRCMHCGNTGEVKMPREAYERYDNGRGQHIQRAWPEGSAGEREQVISGTHPKCFDEMFPPDEE